MRPYRRTWTAAQDFVKSKIGKCGIWCATQRVCCGITLALLLSFGLHARSITERDRSHWAFQPIKRVVPPLLGNATALPNPIDRFIVATLGTNGLALAPRATKQ